MQGIREFKKTNNREKILNAAIKLFTKKGFESVGIETITRQAKLAKGTFYNYFAKKEDVLLYFIDRQIEKVRNEIQLLGLSNHNTLDQIELIIITYLKYIFQNREFSKVLAKERVGRIGKRSNKNELNMIRSLSNRCTSWPVNRYL